MKIFIIIISLYSLFSITCFSQDETWNNCDQEVKNYTLYLQPVTKTVAINETITYNVLFTGDREYIIAFCADSIYYPIHFRILKSYTNIVLYDNASDGYFKSIWVRMYHAQNVMIEVNLMGDKLNKSKKEKLGKVPVRLIMHSRDNRIDIY